MDDAASRLGQRSVPPATYESPAADVVMERIRRAEGESRLDDSAGRLIRNALIHSSYLYEHSDDLPDLSRGLLDALLRVGSALIARRIAVEEYLHQQEPTAAGLSRSVHAQAHLGAWASQQRWLVDSMALSKGLRREVLPARISAEIFQQLLGALCILNLEMAATACVDEFIEHEKTRNAHVADPQHLLEGKVRLDTVEFATTVAGSDHEQEFTTTLTSGMRHATGMGRSKKEARRHAIVNFVQQYFPDAIRPAPSSESPSRPAPAEISQSAGRHLGTVVRLQRLFRLPDSARALFSQALIHTSWAYENKPLMAKYHQQTNQALGLVGSHVLNFEHALAAASAARDTLPASFRLTTITNVEYARAFLRADLSRGTLFGVGQRTQEISDDVSGNMFQAVCAAAYIELGRPLTLLKYWPYAWSGIREIVAPRKPRAFDATTLLEMYARTLGVSLSFQTSGSGPAHLIEHKAIAELSHPTVGSHVVACRPALGNRQQAKHRASHLVLDAARELSTSRELRGARRTAKDPELKLMTYLAKCMVMLASPEEPRVRKLIQYRMLGTHLANDVGEMRTWASNFDWFLRASEWSADDVDRLAGVFRTAVAIAQEASSPAMAMLAEILENLTQLDNPADVDEDAVSRIAQLCDYFRAASSPGSGANWNAVVEAWHIVYQGRLAIVGSPSSDVNLDGRTVAIIDGLVHGLSNLNGRVVIELANHQIGTVRLRCSSVDDSEAFGRLARLWSGLRPGVAVEALSDGLHVTAPSVDHAALTRPAAAAIELAVASSGDRHLAEFANLLHDLRNQLSAARAAVGHPGRTRVEKLEFELAGARHLAEVKFIAKRLAGAAPLLRGPGEDPTNIGPFILRYASSRISSLPSDVALAIPSAASQAFVSLSESALTAILDNLIRNSVEAMTAPGTISLGYTIAEEVARLQIDDDGPGIPSDVIEAFASGTGVHSQKASGSGLGLQSVRRLVSQVGGSVRLARRTVGARVEIELPLADLAEDEDSG